MRVGFILVFLCMFFFYGDVFLQGKIVFPSNFLAQFYSPWSTEKFEGWENGVPHKPIGTDQIRFFYPGRSFTNEMFQRGSFPLWNPYVFSGSVHIADFQSGVFYPLNVLYLLLPQIVAWDTLIFIQPLLAMIFTYLFLRMLTLSKIAAFFGAFAFGFSGFMIAWGQENAVVGHAALWLPLALYGIEGLFKTKKIQYFFVSVFALAFSFLAGFFQITFYIFALVLLYSLFRLSQTKPKERMRYFFWIIGIVVLSIGISAIQLGPSVEGFLESPRSTSQVSYLFDIYLLPITHIINLLAPDIFGSPGAYNFFGRGFYHETVLSIGAIPLVFAIFASLQIRMNRLIRFFLILAVVSFLLTIDTPFTRWFYAVPIPLISTFVPSRILILTTFSLSVLSAFGIDHWFKASNAKSKKNMLIIYITCITLLALTVAYGLFFYFAPLHFLKSSINEHFVRAGGFPGKPLVLVMLRNLTIPIVLLLSSLIFILLKKKRNIAVIGILSLAVIGQFYFLSKYLVLGHKEFLYPPHPTISFLQEHASSHFRFLAFGRPILGNIATLAHIYSPEGLDPIFPKRYGQLLFASKHNGKLAEDIPRIEATLSELGNEESLSDNVARLRLLSLLGTKHLLYYDEGTSKMSIGAKFPKDVFHPIWQKDNWYAFEYTNVLPRAFLVENVIVEKDSQKILNTVFDPHFDLTKNVVLEENPPPLSQTANITHNAEVAILLYEPQKVKLSVKTDEGRLLFLSDNYYPGWHAFVDSTPVKIYRANFTFRAVAVPKGIHTVVFYYNPISFSIGRNVTAVSSIIILGISFTMLLRWFQQRNRI